MGPMKAIAEVEEKVINIEDRIEKEVKKEAALLKEGDVDLNETPVRYLAFLGRIRPIVQPLTRYLAYTSDLGESFRPIISPKIVTATYGVSWLYLIGDVSYEGYKARLRAVEYSPDRQGSVVGISVAKRALFQATASMLLPALTIHSVVRYSALALKKSAIQSKTIRTWVPTALGLSVVPALPFLFDEPVEHVVDKGFDYLEGRFITDPGVKRALKENKVHVD